MTDISIVSSMKSDRSDPSLGLLPSQTDKTISNIKVTVVGCPRTVIDDFLTYLLIKVYGRPEGTLLRMTVKVSEFLLTGRKSKTHT